MVVGYQLSVLHMLKGTVFLNVLGKYSERYEGEVMKELRIKALQVGLIKPSIQFKILIRMTIAIHRMDLELTKS